MGRNTNKRRQQDKRRPRRIRVRGVRREPVDLHQLSRALLDIAQAEADARAQHQQQRDNRSDADQVRSGSEGTDDPAR